LFLFRSRSIVGGMDDVDREELIALVVEALMRDSRVSPAPPPLGRRCGTDAGS
jgi:hypothetical protein